jgi:arabinofuranosyltransferase
MSRHDSRVARVLLGLVIAGGLVHALSYSYVTSDDAFISLRYARNLASGHGLVYNPGAGPVEGFSNPLFTLVATLLLVLSVPPLCTLKLIGLASLGACMALAAALARELAGERAGNRCDYVATAAAALVAASAYPAMWAVAGLETMFYSALLTAGTLAAVRDLSPVPTARIGRSSPWFVTVAATRPEGALLGAAVAAGHWCASGFALRVVGRWLGGFALPCLVLLGLRYWYFGALVPNTFHAKVYFGVDAVVFGAGYLAEFLLRGGLWIVVPAVAGALWLVAVDGRRCWWPVLAVIVAQALFVVLVGGDFMLGYRFVMPVYPLLCVLAALGIAGMVERLTARLVAELTVAATALLAVALFAAQGDGLATHSRRFWLVHDRPWPSYLAFTDLGGTWLSAHAHVGEYIRARADADDVVAVTEAGAIPFYSGLATVDLLGLNDREVSAMWQQQKAATREAREAGAPPTRYWGFDIAAYAMAREPRWIVLDGHFEPTSGALVPRLGIGRWLMMQPAWSEYHEVFRALVYDGRATGLGRDRVNVVFERVDSVPIGE